MGVLLELMDDSNCQDTPEHQTNEKDFAELTQGQAFFGVLGLHG